ncbi:MAG TPA: TetR/AcrR family transcriptional regulator [Acidobacteriaceae bacterium]
MSKGEQTRQAIIERAAPLFNQRGYAGCSLADIMEATGLEKGGLYRHFTCKEELATEVFRYALSTSFAARGLVMEPGGDPVAKLRIMVSHFVGAPSPIPGGCPLFNLAVDADDGNPALRKLAQAGLKRWKRTVADLVSEGMAAGKISSDTNPQAVANVMIATLEGALMITRLEGARHALHHAQNALQEMLTRISMKQRA